MSAVNLDPEGLQAEAFNIPDDTNGRDHCIKFFFKNLAAGFNMRRDFAFATVELLDHGFFHDLHALFNKLLFRKSGDFGIFHGQNPIHNFNYSCVGPEGVEETSEFDSDGS